MVGTLIPVRRMLVRYQSVLEGSKKMSTLTGIEHVDKEISMHHAYHMSLPVNHHEHESITLYIADDVARSVVMRM
jgi:hypothetical protein